MARKARKKSGPAKKTARAKKSKSAPRKKAAKRVGKRKARRARKPPSIGEALSRGYHIVVDTMTGTEKLRKKLEKPGTDETE